MWPTGVSDSDYNKREGYLNRQNNFAKSDLVELVAGSGVLPRRCKCGDGSAAMLLWRLGHYVFLTIDGHG